jgi:hypothetical protein
MLLDLDRFKWVNDSLARIIHERATDDQEAARGHLRTGLTDAVGTEIFILVGAQSQSEDLPDKTGAISNTSDSGFENYGIGGRKQGAYPVFAPSARAT